jgi:arylsulfatase
MVLFAALACWTLNTPPNLVVVFCDDLGYADIGPFGGKLARTPHLDRMAREGRTFTNFHVSQPVCSASRASLLTGCYANRVGIHGALGPNAKIGLNPKETTLASMLKGKGYATACVGKWHLGHLPEFLPTRQGFDSFFGIPYSGDMWPLHPEAPKAYPPLPLLRDTTVVDASVSAEDQKRLTGQFADESVRFIEKSAGKPFFLYLAPNQPHVPLFVGKDFEGKSGKGLYADVIEEIDDTVGRILKKLDDLKLSDNTWVVFTSDNGPWLSYGDHAGSSGGFREGKGTVWEGGTRVPCIMRWPGQIPAGSTSDAMLMTIDLLPTVASKVGAELPSNRIDGGNCWGIISGKADAKNPHSTPEDGYACYFMHNELQAVLSGDGRWKLVLPHTYRTLSGKPGGTGGIPVKYTSQKITQPELYDLKNDPGERKNLAQDQPAELARLQALAEKFRSDLGDTLTQRRGTANREPGKAP